MKSKQFRMKKMIIESICVATFLISPFILGGCNASNSKMDNQNKVSEKKSKDTMSEEEMNKLMDGQIIEKDPNQEYLESKNLIALYKYKVKSVFDDGEVIHDVVYFSKRQKEEEKFEDSFYKWTEYRELENISIHKINDYFLDYDGKTWMKSILFDGKDLIYPVLSESKINELIHQK